MRRKGFLITLLDKFLIFLPTKSGKFLCTLQDLSVLLEIFYLKVYRFYFQPKMVIDVGAHIGTFTIYIKRSAPRAQVIAIEPHPYSRKLLKHNIRLNNLSNIVVVPYAMSSSRGHTTFYQWLGWREASTTKLEFAMSLVRHDKGVLQSYKVPTLTLDSLTENIPMVDLIKIDVEGAEFDVLKGGIKTLRKTRELVIAAYHTPTEADEVEAFLRKHGFVVHRYLAGGVVYLHAVNTLLGGPNKWDVTN